MSPEKGGVLRTVVQRSHRRTLLLIAAVTLLVVPLVLLGAPSPRPHTTLTAAPRQELVSANVGPSATPTTTPAPTHHVVHQVTPRTRAVASGSRAATHSSTALLAQRRVAHQRFLARRAALVRAAQHRAAAHLAYERRVAHAAALRAARARAARAAAARHHHHPIPAAVKGRFREGVATWYSWRPGQCATSYLPRGTRIYVRVVGTNRVISCVVTDRQARRPGRVVDLNEASFSALAPLGRGVVRVIVTW